MFHYVYLLQSEQNNGFYIGYSSDLKRRLSEHNKGLNFSTKNGKPWKLIFYESYLEEQDARRREKYLKTSQGARLIKRMIKEYLYKKKVEK
ncbi:MAG: GIY-YIG nuclease family protein [Patescibacteria group bacterium]